MVSHEVGSRLPTVEKVITQEQIARYAHASGDHNPLHLDPEFAATTQFGGIICHGMLTLAYIAEMLTAAFGRDWLKSGEFKAKFKGPTYPGDRVRTWGEVTKVEPVSQGSIVECSVSLSNHRGEELISGTALLTRGN